MNLFYRLCRFCGLAGFLSFLSFFGLFCLPQLVGAATREAATTFPPAVSQALARAGVPREAVSFEVRAVSNDAAPRLSYKAGVAMNPASVMKLVTTFSALDILGPNFTWKTGFYTDGTLSKGVLTGNFHEQGWIIGLELLGGKVIGKRLIALEFCITGITF